MPDQMDYPEIIPWLLQGDIAIQYQTCRDLLDTDRRDLQVRIETDGWGNQFLSKRGRYGHWGRGFYQPKWISSHYTLLDLRNLNISQDVAEIRETIEKIAREEKSPDGGVNPARTIPQSDVCVNGMFLNYASYFKATPEALRSVVDFILSQHMPDGGFNCQFNRVKTKHSSLHSTLSVLEGITEYEKQGYTYLLGKLQEVKSAAIEFILIHRLFRSDRTGKVIKAEFLRMPYPSRWKYDILRAMDYLRYEGIQWDDRIQEALEILLNKKNRIGTWNLQVYHPGQLHFEMEQPGSPSRWNTLRVMRIIKYFSTV